jgi:hypothetical protein
LECEEGSPVPTVLVAVTVNVYAVPFVRPVTVVLVAGGDPVIVFDVWAPDPMYGVTVYDVIGRPPLGGAAQVTVAEPSPAVAVTPVGAPGTVGPVGVTEFEGSEGAPVPTALVAVTVNVYAVPFVRPVTVVLVAGGDPVTVFGVCAVDPMYGVTV